MASDKDKPAANAADVEALQKRLAELEVEKQQLKNQNSQLVEQNAALQKGSSAQRPTEATTTTKPTWKFRVVPKDGKATRKAGLKEDEVVAVDESEALRLYVIRHKIDMKSSDFQFFVHCQEKETLSSEAQRLALSRPEWGQANPAKRRDIVRAAEAELIESRNSLQLQSRAA